MTQVLQKTGAFFLKEYLFVSPGLFQSRWSASNSIEPFRNQTQFYFRKQTQSAETAQGDISEKYKNILKTIGIQKMDADVWFTSLEAQWYVTDPLKWLIPHQKKTSFSLRTYSDISTWTFCFEFQKLTYLFFVQFSKCNHYQVFKAIPWSLLSVFLRKQSQMASYPL